MLYLLKNGSVFINGAFQDTSVLVCYGVIIDLKNILEFKNNELKFEEINCQGLYIIPGLIDPHLHLAGGSGERGGFITQSHRILAAECVRGGITTAVGTLGVDTTTITMRALLASTMAMNQAGLTARAYTGGYDVPPKTLFGSVHDDIVFVKEIIGVGEIAIADRRAAEPSLAQLAKICVDAYVAGMLSGKCGVTHIHVGAGKNKLKTIEALLSEFEIIPAQLYLTHIERNEELIFEGIKLAHKGCYIDFDVSLLDLEKSYTVFQNSNGDSHRLTFSSDAGVGSPSDLWQEIRKCVLQFNMSLVQLLPHVTSIPAKVLQFKNKGSLFKGADADLICVSQDNLEIIHVMAHGKWLMQNKIISFPNQHSKSRRGFDLYEIH